MEKGITGKRGEAFAAEYYRKRGFTVRAMNYHSRYGEIDVIAENDEHVIFCEVKTRSGTVRVKPCEAVDMKKQQRLTLTAFKYLESADCEKAPRFDVFEVWVNDRGIFKFNNIENAFESTELSGRYDVF